MSKQETVTLYGTTLSPGLGRGKTFVYHDVLKRVDEFYDIEEVQVDQELDRLIKAINYISEELTALASDVEERMDPGLSDVFRAHAAMVQDSCLQDEVEKEIRTQLVSAGAAVRSVFRRWEKRFHALGSSGTPSRGDDIRDLARRLVASLAGIRSHALDHLPEGCVLVAKRLLPSDTIYLARHNTAAAVLEVGGAGSHAALFAHAIGLPCVVGIPRVVDRVPCDAMALVDADAGRVIVNPDQADDADFVRRFRRREHVAAEALSHADEPAITRNGKIIRVYANVGGADDTRLAIENGAEGVGLYRIETAYLSRQTPPSGEDLFEELRATLAPAGTRPVYVRLLDAGGDKPLPFLDPLAEINPALGLRGVRLLEKYPALLRKQLQVLLRLSAEFDLHILVPMVTVPHDMAWVKNCLEQEAAEQGVASLPKLGAMIETPSAVLTAGGMADLVSFLSFGTNDLTQYTFAADRENTAVNAYFDDTHPAIFRLLTMVHEDLPDMPLSVCGELASRSGCIARLLQCGITTLSVAPPSIPEVKQAIRQTDGGD